MRLSYGKRDSSELKGMAQVAAFSSQIQPSLVPVVATPVESPDTVAGDDGKHESQCLKKEVVLVASLIIWS
jgi:hypothetical protein